MAEITDPALYMWVVMKAELRRRSEENAQVLTPDCTMTPTQLLAALNRHGKQFLARARYNVDFFHPFQTNGTDGPFTASQEEEEGKFTDAYTCVLSGQIARIRQDKPGVAFNEIALECPDWAPSGWTSTAFVEMWEAQRYALREVYRPIFRSWVDDQLLLVNFGDRLPYPVCLVPSDNGSYEATKPISSSADFPFKIGDTVVVQGHLHRLTVERRMPDEASVSIPGYVVQASKIKVVKARARPEDVEESSDNDEADLMTSTPVSSSKNSAMSSIIV
uniref:Uncharacterized protein n=1 Tax=Mycena chlorophos TaxID=658473 RepID=A0ABQ0KUC6_MYCCL|nr:predicted protein [Mycena chlorophos]